MNSFDNFFESQEQQNGDKETKDVASYIPVARLDHVDVTPYQAELALDNSLSHLNGSELVIRNKSTSLMLGDVVLSGKTINHLNDAYGINQKLLMKAESGDPEARQKVVEKATRGIELHASVASGPSLTNYFYDPSLDPSVGNLEEDNADLWMFKERYSV